MAPPRAPQISGHLGCGLSGFTNPPLMKSHVGSLLQTLSMANLYEVLGLFGWGGDWGVFWVGDHDCSDRMCLCFAQAPKYLKNMIQLPHNNQYCFCSIWWLGSYCKAFFQSSMPLLFSTRAITCTTRSASNLLQASVQHLCNSSHIPIYKCLSRTAYLPMMSLGITWPTIECLRFRVMTLPWQKFDTRNSDGLGSSHVLCCGAYGQMCQIVAHCLYITYCLTMTYMSCSML